MPVFFVFLGSPRVLLIVRFRRTCLRMICIIITSIMARRLFSRSNLNSLFSMANGEAVSRRSLFFHGLLAGSWGYIHQTPSAPIVSLHLRSFDDLQDPFRPFMHTLKYRPSRKFFMRTLYVAFLSLVQWLHERRILKEITNT